MHCFPFHGFELFICSCVCMGVVVMCMVFRRKPEQGAGHLPLFLSPFFLEMGSRTEAEACPFVCSCWPVSSQDPLVSAYHHRDWHVAMSALNTGKSQETMTGVGVGRGGRMSYERKDQVNDRCCCRWILGRKKKTVIEISRKCQSIL